MFNNMKSIDGVTNIYNYRNQITVYGNGFRLGAAVPYFLPDLFCVDFSRKSNYSL